MSPSKIELGASYKDKITGFTGIATGRVEYISGCNQGLLTARVDKDGKPCEPAWFDEQRLEKQDTQTIVLENEATPGCDKSAPIR